MKHLVFFSIVTISSFSYSMDDPIELLPLSQKKRERENARLVAGVYAENLHILAGQYLGVINLPEDNNYLENLRKSRLTDQEKQQALDALNNFIMLDSFFSLGSHEKSKKRQRMG